MNFLDEAQKIKDAIVADRRYFHINAEVDFDLALTISYVKSRLAEMGYETKDTGGGVVALAGGKKPGKVFLLRADMDALPIVEETDLPYKSTNGNMHACGHDLHTAMLLGAASILKKHENEIEGTVKLMFQPAEETLVGAKAMIDAGLLENPRVDAGMMIHVTAGTGLPVKTGQLLVPEDGIGYASADWFRIDVQGKGGHGASPSKGIDPLNVLAHIFIALQAINAREVKASESCVLTIGEMHGGNTSNVIPDTAYMSGTIRTFDAETRDFIKQRLVEISKNTAEVFRAAASVSFPRECPMVVNNGALAAELGGYAKEILGQENVVMKADINMSRSAGTEDFAYICENIPAASFGMGAAANEYGAHHPKTAYDENALPAGAAVYAYAAFRWLRNNKSCSCMV